MYRKDNYRICHEFSNRNDKKCYTKSKHWLVIDLIAEQKLDLCPIGIYQIVLSWVPTATQYGPQGFCAGAIDNSNVQSEQWCITYLVGFDSPDIIRPTTVQGSASPLGTIFQNHTLFSIQSNDILRKDLILTDGYLFILIDF